MKHHWLWLRKWLVCWSITIDIHTYYHSCAVMHLCLLSAASRRDDILNEKFTKKRAPQRPKTTSTVARRMVSHALGVRITANKETRQKKS